MADPQTDGTLGWFPNLSGDDDREVPEINPFWLLKDLEGNVSAFRHENFQLLDPQGNLIEAQDNIYPPHVFNLQSGRLADGFILQINAQNPPGNLPAYAVGDNGIVNIQQMDMFLGWMTPDPENPDTNIRFNPYEEGFTVAYVQTEQDVAPALNQIEVPMPDYSRVNEAFITRDTEPVVENETEEELEQEIAPEPKSEEVVEQTIQPEAVEIETETKLQNESVSSPLDNLNNQLSSYIDIVGPGNSQALQALLDGEFGEPTITDLAFVAEAVYALAAVNFNEEGYRGEAQQQVFEDLQTILPDLREANAFYGEDVGFQSVGDGFQVSVDAYDFLGQTSFMNDPEFSAQMHEREQHLEALNSAMEAAQANGQTYDLTVEDRMMLSTPQLPRASSEHDDAMMTPRSSEEYLQHAQGITGDILDQDYGMETILANFHENNDPDVFPLTPILNEDGSIMTSENAGVVYSHWQNMENGQQTMLTGGMLGRELEALVDINGGLDNLQSFLAEHPEYEPAIQVVSTVLQEVETQSGNVEPQNERTPSELIQEQLQERLVEDRWTPTSIINDVLGR